MPGLQPIAKPQPCGFLRPAGKFDARFPDVRSLRGSAGRHGTAQRIPPAASCLTNGGELSTVPPVPCQLCHAASAMPAALTHSRFALSPSPPAKIFPVFHPLAVLGDRGDEGNLKSILAWDEAGRDPGRKERVLCTAGAWSPCHPWFLCPASAPAAGHCPLFPGPRQEMAGRCGRCGGDNR